MRGCPLASARISGDQGLAPEREPVVVVPDALDRVDVRAAAAVREAPRARDLAQPAVQTFARGHDPDVGVAEAEGLHLLGEVGDVPDDGERAAAVSGFEAERLGELESFADLGSVRLGVVEQVELLQGRTLFARGVGVLELEDIPRLPRLRRGVKDVGLPRHRPVDRDGDAHPDAVLRHGQVGDVRDLADRRSDSDDRRDRTRDDLTCVLGDLEPLRLASVTRERGGDHLPRHLGRLDVAQDAKLDAPQRVGERFVIALRRLECVRDF